MSNKHEEKQKNEKQKKNVSTGALLITLVSLIAAPLMSISGETILSYVFSALLIFSLLTLVLLNAYDIKKYFLSRQGRSGFDSSISILFILALSTGIYLLFFFELINVRVDLTKNKLYSLSRQSKTIIKKLDFPIHVKVFNIEKKKDYILEFLKNYKRFNKNFQWTFVNLLKNPQEAKKYNISRQGTLVFTAKNRTPIKLPYSDMVKQTYNEMGQPETQYLFEEKITSSILSMIETKKNKIYFTTGHGEYDIENFESGGLSKIKERLELENIKSFKLEMIKTRRIPDDAEMIVIAGPRGKFTTSEINALDKFLQNKGALFLMIDPVIDIRVTTGLEDLLKKYGIILHKDAVVDTVQFAPQIGRQRGNPLFPILDYDYHKIVNPLNEKNMKTVFFSARSLRKKQGLPKYYVYNAIVNGSEHAWGETSIKSNHIPRYDKNTDYKPVCVGAVMQIRDKQNNYKNVTNEIRIAVLGDSEFAINDYVDIAGHKDLFINTVRWLMNQENFISIRPKKRQVNQLYLPHSERQIASIFFLIVLPLLILTAGMIVIYKRRNKKDTEKT